MPKNGIAGSYGKSIFSFLGSIHTAFHSSYMNLHSHHQCLPHPYQHFLLFVF
jgi:hypothetical protein